MGKQAPATRCDYEDCGDPHDGPPLGGHHFPLDERIGVPRMCTKCRCLLQLAPTHYAYQFEGQLRCGDASTAVSKKLICAESLSNMYRDMWGLG
jgi:hypothetical protein